MAMELANHQAVKRVKGISDRPLSWPRLGKWYLGAKYRNTDAKRPSNLNYFRAPEEFDVERWCGSAKPEELQIELPSDNPELCLTDQLELWGSQEGLKCYGDGEHAQRMGPEGWNDQVCHCDMLKPGGCSYKLRLWFLMPKVPGLGVWQLSSASPVTADRLRGDMQMIQTVFGRLTRVPLVLWRQSTEFHPMVTGKDGKKRRIKATQPIPRIRVAEMMELAHPETGEIEEVAVTIDLMRRMSAQFEASGQPALRGEVPPVNEAPEDMPRDLVDNATPVYPEGEEPPEEPDPWAAAAEEPEPEPPVYDEPEPEPEEDAGAVEPEPEGKPGVAQGMF